MYACMYACVSTGVYVGMYVWIYALIPVVVQVNATDWEGTGSYADLRGTADINGTVRAHYAGMGYKLNWDSTARFPFHGMWYVP